MALLRKIGGKTEALKSLSIRTKTAHRPCPVESYQDSFWGDLLHSRVPVGATKHLVATTNLEEIEP
jgi:hypothetical protein